MKKYLMGMVAIVLAVGLSAFTNSNSSTSSKKLTDYFWYPVNPATMETSGETINPVETISKDDAKSLSGCNDDNSQPICLYGFGNNDISTGTPVGSDPDKTVLETHQ